jgi:hypothetical protein
MSRPRTTGLVTAVLVTCAVGGCAAGGADGGETACTAIGWSDLLRVEVRGDAARVEAVRYCDTDGCWPDPSASPGSGPLGDVTRSGDTWNLTIFGAPESVTLQLVAGDGTVLREVERDPGWVRVGGTEECGGPHEATVTVTR